MKAIGESLHCRKWSLCFSSLISLPGQREQLLCTRKHPQDRQHRSFAEGLLLSNFISEYMGREQITISFHNFILESGVSPTSIFLGTNVRTYANIYISMGDTTCSFVTNGNLERDPDLFSQSSQTSTFNWENSRNVPNFSFLFLFILISFFLVSRWFSL
jgi:hypothetical protein